jgi:hypothetical protein
MYSNDEKHGEYNKTAFAVAHLCRNKRFPKNSSFFSQFKFNQANDVYVKI